MNASVQTTKITHVVKRDGRRADFAIAKIVEAIFKAAQSVGGDNRDLALNLAYQVLEQLEEKYDEPTVENLQDLVERILIENGHVRTAKAYILYRYKKTKERERSAIILGKKDTSDSLDFTYDALKILERRYLLRDKAGVTETPRDMIWRVAHNVAKGDSLYGITEEQIEETASKFFDIMASLKFLPNSPTLINAGSKIQQLPACFVLPLEDKMDGIFKTLHDAAVIHQRGAGTGFSFSRLRPKNDPVSKNLGVAAGPVAFMNVFDKALESIKQGGVRPGANMAVLRVDHPDIIRFIECKRNKNRLKNFNVSVAVTDRFMRAVEEDREYFIKNPRTNKFFGKLRARDVFAVITQNAWKTGDPGLIFIDEINRKHPAKHLGEIETTNQCAEAPLLPNESCCLGSIDVNKFVMRNHFNWTGLKETVRTSVHFLDNAIDVTTYSTKETEEATKLTRKFGLGIMGFADMLMNLGIKYDSEQGLEIGEKLMKFIKDAAYEMSEELAKKRGVCPAWKGSEHERVGRKIRNMTCIALSPTGTRSIFADTSPGCEPVFAISFHKTVLESNQVVSLNKAFERIAHEREFYSPELINKVTKLGSIQTIKEIPKDVRDIFVTAQDIDPEWHIKMQSTLQKHVDNAISKTINFPRTAAIRDVENAYLLAWKARCKGITIYRDGSYEDQVITIGEGL
jgi:ribonucleoside-diphosphate reductase alpha chain